MTTNNPSLSPLPELTPTGTIIKLSAEASKAIKRNGPSDKKLREILNGSLVSRAATSQEQRWMAAYILRDQGYILE
jgi:hypothetical protein